MHDEDALIRRAEIAHKKAGGIDIPSNVSGVDSVDGNAYVVLRRGMDVMQVYAVLPNGSLRGLKTVPTGIE